jgi:hypothetical protein
VLARRLDIHKPARPVLVSDDPTYVITVSDFAQDSLRSPLEGLSTFVSPRYGLSLPCHVWPISEISSANLILNPELLERGTGFEPATITLEE